MLYMAERYGADVRMTQDALRAWDRADSARAMGDRTRVGRNLRGRATRCCDESLLSGGGERLTDHISRDAFENEEVNE